MAPYDKQQSAFFSRAYVSLQCFFLVNQQNKTYPALTFYYNYVWLEYVYICWCAASINLRKKNEIVVKQVDMRGCRFVQGLRSDEDTRGGNY